MYEYPRQVFVFLVLHFLVLNHSDTYFCQTIIHFNFFQKCASTSSRDNIYPKCCNSDLCTFHGILPVPATTPAVTLASIRTPRTTTKAPTTQRPATKTSPSHTAQPTTGMITLTVAVCKYLSVFLAHLSGIVHLKRKLAPSLFV